MLKIIELKVRFDVFFEHYSQRRGEELLLCSAILAQHSNSIPPENVRKPLAS